MSNSGNTTTKTIAKFRFRNVWLSVALSPLEGELSSICLSIISSSRFSL